MENTSVQRGLFLTFRLISLIRPGLRPVHLPRRGRLPPAGAFPYLPLGEGAAAAAEEGRYRVGSGSRLTPVRATPCHPLPGEGFSPHPSRVAPGPHSPWGKAAYRRGRSLTFPWGKVPPQRRKRGGIGLVLGPAPHPSGLCPATLSQERVFPLIRHALRRATFPAGEGDLPAGVLITFPLAFQTIFPFTPFTNPLLCCKIGSSSQKLWEVWS